MRTLRLAIRARLKLSYSVIVEGMKYATDLYINRNLLFDRSTFDVAPKKNTAKKTPG